MTIIYDKEDSRITAIYFDLKGYESSQGLIKALIRISQARTSTQTICGICKEYNIRRRVSSTKKTESFSITATREEAFFYGTEKELRSNYRHEIELPIFNYYIEKNNNQTYYRVPLPLLKFDGNKIGLINKIFNDIKSIIKEQPEKLEKRVIKEEKLTFIHHFPKDFVNEIKEKRHVYFFR